ncbi:MAG: ribonuclease H-like domain-containing protein [Chloroflexi bacterium]|nr:ribonuclease H-like domain-containing protein [Chloroflexota bacterium]
MEDSTPPNDRRSQQWSPNTMQSLRRRLRRMQGQQTSRVDRAAVPPPPTSASALRQDIARLTNGETLKTVAGSVYVVMESLPGEHIQGHLALADWFAADPHWLAHLAENAAFADHPLENAIFLDTETTGLDGSSLAFMVGLGYFEGRDQFVVRQYFLRNPAEEDAMLLHLAETLTPDRTLVTFNGRGFDLRLLTHRFALAGIDYHLNRLPHLDLLPPARRLWRRRLPSCSLGSLEDHILGLARSHEDVPGWQIPQMYAEYVRSRDATDMLRVLYHNRQDILSMVTLGVQLSRTYAEPANPLLPVSDRLSLARWFTSRDMVPEALAAFASAAADAPTADLRYECLDQWADLLKRFDNRSEALPLWQDMADLKIDPKPFEEIAKYYEWHADDLSSARDWTAAGIAWVESWRQGFERVRALETLTHRLERLERKLRSGGEVNTPPLGGA